MPSECDSPIWKNKSVFTFLNSQIEGFINTILCSTEVVGHPVRMTHKLCDGKTIMSCAMLKQEAVKKGTKISNCELIEDNPFKGAGGYLGFRS